MAKGLEDSFDEAIGAFNSRDYEKLVTLLDPDVILKRVDDPGSVVGIGNVMAYLSGRQRKLHPRLSEIRKEEPREQDGQISGTAKYHDSETDEDGTEVRFTFTFEKSEPDGDWLLVNAFAAPR